VKILHSPLLKLKLKDKHFEEAGYRDYSNNLVLLASDGTQSAIGKEFFVEEQTGG